MVWYDMVDVCDGYLAAETRKRLGADVIRLFPSVLRAGFSTKKKWQTERGARIAERRWNRDSAPRQYAHFVRELQGM